jgi:glycosyltransferase involved in cell wall biosynthesis
MPPSPQPCFALVTPSYQQAPFLRACVDSVLAQTEVRTNYAVHDGGSTDGSVDLLRSYGGRVRWQTGPDGGQVRAINRGLQELDGEFCGYLNSDDVLAPGALARVAAEFARHPEAEVIYGRAWWIDAAGRPTREYPTRPYDFNTLVQHCFIAQPAAFWRRQVHTSCGWFDPAFDTTFDYEFWLRLATRGRRFHYLPEVLAESREHAATKSTTRRGQVFREIRRMQLRHLGYCGRNWWEQQLRYWRDESGAVGGRLLPGRREERLYRLAWWPYVLCRRKLGGPCFHRPGDFRC